MTVEVLSVTVVVLSVTVDVSIDVDSLMLVVSSVLDVDCVVVDRVDSVENVGTGGVKTFSGGFGSVHTKCEMDCTRIYNLKSIV